VSARKTPIPFMVFAEAVPQSIRLADSKIPPEERARLLRDVNDSIDIVKAVADRNTQSGRHKKNHERRDRVLAGLRRDEHGVPLRGEPKRLANRHRVSVRTVEKWIAQLRRTRMKGAEAVLVDWRTVALGERVRHVNQAAARKRRKRGD
jgi:hypothetical protein